MRTECKTSEITTKLIDRYRSMMGRGIDCLSYTPLSENEKERYVHMTRLSTENLTEKWRTGRKTLRTEIAYRGLTDYPESKLDASLLLDAVINLLDDVYDEAMGKDEMSLYIVELISAISKMGSLISEEDRDTVEAYFQKILVIAFSELLLRDRIAESSSHEERLSHVTRCYAIKSMDMDAFIELPLRAKGFDEESVSRWVELGRVHRAISIIVKDLDDLEHDRRVGEQTPVVILCQGSDAPCMVLDDCVKHFEEEAENVWMLMPEEQRTIGENLYAMIGSAVELYEEN